jgi:hypothetical protein
VTCSSRWHDSQVSHNAIRHNSLWITLVADACSDGTARLAREALGAFGQVVQICAHSARAAHRLGASIVMEHFRDVPRHTLLLPAQMRERNCLAIGSIGRSLLLGPDASVPGYRFLKLGGLKH